jgi:hypothetical protein
VSTPFRENIEWDVPTQLYYSYSMAKSALGFKKLFDFDDE